MRQSLVRGIVMMLILLVGRVSAQESVAVTLVPFTNEVYGIEGVVPEGWQDTRNGLFRREPGPTDPTLLALQTAPVAADVVLTTLLPQLGLTEPPDPVEVLETDFFNWTLYRVDFSAPEAELVVDLALTEKDGKTYLALLQTKPDEYDSLHAEVFLPALQAYAPLATETTPEDLPYVAEKVTFKNGDVTLAGTLTLPEGGGMFPAVILISGSGQQDRDESLAPLAAIKPFRLIADHLTRSGIAVLRYDDRGVGGSTGDPSTATSADFAGDAASAIDYLLTRADINPEQIGILGHSEGGTIAAMLGADNPNVAFIVSLAGTAVPGSDIIMEQNALILQANGATEETILTQTALMAQTHELVLADDAEALRTLIYETALEQIEALPEDERKALGDIESYAGTLADQQTTMLMSPWYRFFLDYDPGEDWAKVTVPVLGIFGELDLQVPAEQNAPMLEAALDEAGNADYEIVTIPAVNHLFQTATTGSPNEYGTLEQTFGPDLLPLITDWLLARVDVVE
jgi:uncharacterized protein